MALDKKQIIQRVFNASTSSLSGIDKGAATAPQPACYLSARQIWKRVYDATNQKIQVVQAP